MTYLEEVEQGKVEYVTKIYSFEDSQGEDMSEALYRAYNL